MSAHPQVPIATGEHLARTRWNTHESGEAFDRKKTTYLTPQAQLFMAQQTQCVVAGPGLNHDLCGMVTFGFPGFVQIIDAHNCIVQLDNQYEHSCLVKTLARRTEMGKETHLGLFFIYHPTRERLCVQGIARLLPGVTNRFGTYVTPTITLQLQVRQAFFHCNKYIKTRIVGLTNAVEHSSVDAYHLPSLPQRYLSPDLITFIAQQTLCFLCTVNRSGQCAVNHRGGRAGFLVTVPPTNSVHGGTLLLPDYTGNGAFEAIGNILETGLATLLIPDYRQQVALSISGSAQTLEMEELPANLLQSCSGAERVVALRVQHVEIQRGDWSSVLSYEQARTRTLADADAPVTDIVACLR